MFYTIFGLAFFAVLYGAIVWRHSMRWRYLADAYAGKSGQPVEARRMQSGVLIGLGEFESLYGILNISVHETGVGLRILLPYSLFRTPLFIPYSDVQGWVTTWYLNAPSTELSLRRAPDVKITMPAEQAE